MFYNISRNLGGMTNYAWKEPSSLYFYKFTPSMYSFIEQNDSNHARIHHLRRVIGNQSISPNCDLEDSSYAAKSSKGIMTSIV